MSRFIYVNHRILIKFKKPNDPINVFWPYLSYIRSKPSLKRKILSKHGVSRYKTDFVGYFLYLSQNK